jgi:geranylgeranyl transferase type-2 subunit alpha
MHGRKRVPIDEANRIKQLQKARSLTQMLTGVMAKRSTPEGIAELVAGPTEFLDSFDDFASIWNLRKAAFDPSAEASLKLELNISLRVLKRNPKSYWAWHHRRWCSEQVPEYQFNQEVALADQFLAADSRNFHAWRHRRWAVAKCPGILETEKEKSLDLIKLDPGNFSAWHYRSQLQVDFDFKQEIDIAKSAFWTAPYEQSAWIYYRWLLNRPALAADVEFLREEIAQMEELADEEKSLKYPVLALVWLTRKLQAADGGEDLEGKIADLKTKVSALDPVRQAYYAEL